MKLNDIQRSLCLIFTLLFFFIALCFMADEHGLSAVITFAFGGVGLFALFSGDYKSYFSRRASNLFSLPEKLQKKSSIFGLPNWIFVILPLALILLVRMGMTIGSEIQKYRTAQWEAQAERALQAWSEEENKRAAQIQEEEARKAESEKALQLKRDAEKEVENRAAARNAAKELEIISFQAALLYHLQGHLSPTYGFAKDRNYNPLAFKLLIKNSNDFPVQSIKVTLYFYSPAGDWVQTVQKGGFFAGARGTDYDRSLDFDPVLEPGFVKTIEGELRNIPEALEAKIDLSKTKIEIIEAQKPDPKPASKF